MMGTLAETEAAAESLPPGDPQSLF